MNVFKLAIRQYDCEEMVGVRHICQSNTFELFNKQYCYTIGYSWMSS